MKGHQNCSIYFIYIYFLFKISNNHVLSRYVIFEMSSNLCVPKNIHLLVSIYNVYAACVRYPMYMFYLDQAHMAKATIKKLFVSTNVSKRKVRYGR